MASGMTSSKRFAVRLSLVTSSTVAMIVGAQSLATLDQVNAAPVDTAAVSPVVQTTTLAHAAPTITLVRHPAVTNSAAPSVTINPQTSAGQTVTQPQVAMQAPVPVLVSPSSQVLTVPNVPRTRSSR